MTINESVRKACIEFGMKEEENHRGVPNCGALFHMENNEESLRYWIYETDLFIVSIHDMFSKQEKIFEFDWKDYPTWEKSISSSYTITAHGEILSPYKSFCDHMFVVWANTEKACRCCLHGGFRYQSVDFAFKEEFIETYFEGWFGCDKKTIVDKVLFSTFQVPKRIEEIAMEVLSLKKEPRIEELMLESKAKEWASIMLETYVLEHNKVMLNDNDKEGIRNVAKYIDDHFAMEIKQKFLAQLAYMSPTKLRECFKQEYNMTITEYIQRKRISMAEVMLCNTDYPIKEVARLVGYTSHSRFSSLYFKYMGMYPSEVRLHKV